ncbi:MAG: 1-acyl-sn-glycerol-3-phosphate acyltransferase [Salinibacterium sp.]|nr:MAG: 1-acyl-sn-glycerol-3-phosphate acyltransferase [Salinibacterium sp.]
MAEVTAPRSEKTAIFRALSVVVLPFMNALARYELLGTENVPKRGAFVLSPNHYSNIDPVMIGVAMWNLGRMPRFLAKASLFKIPVVGWILVKSGQIPVERSGSARKADPLAAAQRVVDGGLAIIIYPEGSLTRDPHFWPMRGKAGAVRMALEAGIPLIPVASWGAQRVLPRYSKRLSFFPRKTVRIRFGAPLDLSEFLGKPIDAALLTKATEKLMAAITALLEDLRGEKAPAERWDPAKHGQSETGRF